jgi:hypothetical protein
LCGCAGRLRTKKRRFPARAVEFHPNLRVLTLNHNRLRSLAGLEAARGLQASAKPAPLVVQLA